MKSNRRRWMKASPAAMMLTGLAAAGWMLAMPIEASAVVEFGLRSTGSAVYQPVDNGIQIAFAAQSVGNVPVFRRGAVVAGGDAFTGDLTAAGMQAVTFQIRSDNGTVPSAARLMLRGATSGRIWARPFAVAGNADVWQAHTIGLSRADGWDRGGRRGGDKDAMFAADLADVAWLALEVEQGSRAAEAYTIVHLALTGTGGTTPDAELTPLQRALRARFGVNSLDELTDAQRREDSLGDGMSDWERILAENDEDYANAIFKVRIVSVSDAGVTIRWPAVAGSTYTVFRSQQLAAGFNLLPDGLGAAVVADVTGMLDFVDPSARTGVSYYYRVMRKESGQ